MSTKVTLAALVAIAVALGVTVLVSAVAVPVETKIMCQTRSGNTPDGQQD